MVVLKTLIVKFEQTIAFVNLLYLLIILLNIVIRFDKKRGFFTDMDYL